MDVYREGRNWLCPSLPLAAGPLQAPNVHTRGSTSLCLLFIPYIHFQTSLDVYREDRNWLCPSLSLAAWPLQAPNVHTRGSASLCLLFIPYIHFQTSLDVYRGIKRRTPLGMSLYALLVLAERQGFEPWKQLPACRSSSAVRSTTPASLRFFCMQNYGFSVVPPNFKGRKGMRPLRL